MPGDLSVWPAAASEHARDVDRLGMFFLAVCGFFMVLIAGLIITFAFRYRRRHPDQVAPLPKPSLLIEIIWSLVPLGVVLALFAWGARLYIDAYAPANGGLEVFVTGKQWMWKIQYPNGRAEINTVHVPADTPVTLTMISEDVIHSFYVPALRIKRDVLPGRFVRLSFTADRAGEYRLFCAEYCGANHSRMIGHLVVLTPSDYQNWLGGDGERPSMADAGHALFQRHGCDTCHRRSDRRGPSLIGIYGRPARLRSGEMVTVDDDYLRRSILDPAAARREGEDYDVTMPSFAGQLSEERLVELVAFIRSLSEEL